MKAVIRELFFVGSLVSLPLFLAAACSAEAPPAEPSHAAPLPPASAPVSPAQAAAPVLGAGGTPASPAKAAARATTAAAGGVTTNSVPVPMPGGGVRIDMRNNTTNVRVLEKQADGTFKETCTDVPSINKPASQKPSSQPGTSP